MQTRYRDYLIWTGWLGQHLVADAPWVILGEDTPNDRRQRPVVATGHIEITILCCRAIQGAPDIQDALQPKPF